MGFASVLDFLAESTLLDHADVLEAVLKPFLAVLGTRMGARFHHRLKKSHDKIRFLFRARDYYPLMSPWTSVPGDLNDDGIVNILDVVIMASSYGATHDDPNWNPEADLASPWGVINQLDLVTATSHYSTSWKKWEDSQT